MAYVTARRDGAFEVRESRSTPAGPRSRTLATFRELDAATIEKVNDALDVGAVPIVIGQNSPCGSYCVGKPVADRTSGSVGH